MLKTDRLILRPWTLDDANELFLCAKNEKIGYNCGWPAHKNVEESKDIIQTILSEPYTYAICLKSNNKAIGNISIIKNAKHDEESISTSEVEVGYWLGEEYWGNGYVPEAFRKIIEYSFNELNATRIWCCNFDDNYNSARVKEKLGFIHFKTNMNSEAKLINRTVNSEIGYIDKNHWEQFK